MSEKAYRLISAFFTSVEEGLRVLNAEPELLKELTGLGETPLHYLAVENHLDAVKALVEEKGAEINTVNNCGESPLSEASILGYLDLVNYLLSKGASLSLPKDLDPVLHSAVRSNKVEVVKVILAAGAPINEVIDLNETALHFAAQDDCRADAVEYLLEAGAEVNAQEGFGETPLDIAVWNGAKKIISILKKAGGIESIHET